MDYKFCWGIPLIIFLAACTPDQSDVTQTPYSPNNIATPTVNTIQTLEPTASSPAFSTDVMSGLIAFYSDRDGNPEIYIMKPDGSGVKRLTNDPGFDDSPAISPDGSCVAFLTARHDPDPRFPNLKYEIYVIDSGGSNLRRLTTTDAAEDHPSWSPDVKKIIFDADYDEDGDLDAFINCHQFFTPSQIYLNDGAGNFQDNNQDLGDATISAAEVNLLDLNGDGHMDVHVVYYDPIGLPDKVYWNDGNANFSDSGLVLNEETIVWGDLDGDGDVDYFGKSWGTGYVVQLNDGSGQFSIGWQLDDEQSTIGSIALADFDADGDLDALVTNGSRNTGTYPSRLFLNDGNGQFSDSGGLLNETVGAELAIGDLDLDGDLDVFVANMDLPNEVWFNESGQLIDSGLRLGEKSDMSGKPSLGDLDGDGDLDVFIGRFKCGAEIWMNNLSLANEK